MEKMWDDKSTSIFNFEHIAAAAEYYCLEMLFPYIARLTHKNHYNFWHADFMQKGVPSSKWRK